MTDYKRQLVEEGFDETKLDRIVELSKLVECSFLNSKRLTPKEMAVNLLEATLSFFDESIDLRGRQFLNAIKINYQPKVISVGIYGDIKFVTNMNMGIHEKCYIDMISQLEITDEVIDELGKLSNIIPEIKIIVSARDIIIVYIPVLNAESE